MSSSSSSGISPASSATMSSSDSQRADQIVFHFYTKLFSVVSQSRTTNSLPGKLDKWFNLETPDSDLFTKEDREPYKSISSVPPPPLEIQVLLTVPELANNQVLVHLPPDSSRVRIHPTPRFVLLETFVLDFVPGPQADVPLPTIYKHGILLFRSLFTLLMVLPAWKLHKRLRRRAASLGITLRVCSRNDPDILSLTNAESKIHTFPPLPHPKGLFTLSTTYLAHPTFQLEELESLLSSRFLLQDQRPFTPTLARASAASSSSSLPRSPPRPPSSLPRSSLGKQSNTAVTLGTGTPPPSTRAQILKQPDSSISSLSPSNSFYTQAAGQDIQPRPRYPFPFKSNTVSSSTAFPSSSLGSGSGHPSSLSDRIAKHERERVASLPHPPDFSCSQSPSQSQRTGPIPLHVRQASFSRPTSLRDSPEDHSISTSASTSASGPAGTRKRYSSSFGHRYAPTPPSPSTSSPSHARPVPIYSHSPSPSPSSPSFPRPVPTLTHSPSSPIYPVPRPGRSSIGKQVRTDDEDISLFVQDIDMRKPLVGRLRTGSASGRSRAGSVVEQLQHQVQQPRHTDVFDNSHFDGSPSTSPSTSSKPKTPSPSAETLQEALALAQSPPGGLMLTSEAEVDARLSKMNEAFLRSLQGLGSGSGRRRERSESQSQGQGHNQAGSSSRASRSSGPQERVWEHKGGSGYDVRVGRDREQSGGRGGGGPWIGQPPAMLVRQGSQEVVGRMDIYSGGVDLDDLDPHRTHGY
ncbi:hypothetical protein C0995_011672 [Termitomyces sp. Mi166|nr:hypothetical protein C0995_011672 [Termitomyces sp. Mi166\